MGLSIACVLSLAHKAVTNAGFRQNELGPRRIVLDFFSHMSHINANVVAVLDMGRTPDCLQELAMSQDGIRIGDQVGQQSKFNRRQVYLLPILFDNVLAEIGRASCRERV